MSEREAFEAYMLHRFGATNLVRSEDGYISTVSHPGLWGTYASVQMLWEAWQARAQPAQAAWVPSGCALVPIKPTQEMMDAAAHISVCREDVWREMLMAGKLLTTPQDVDEWFERVTGRPATKQPAQAVPLLSDDECLKAIAPETWAHIEGVWKERALHDARAIEQAVRAKMGVAVPMTDAQIDDMATACKYTFHATMIDHRALARAVEAHHGIVGKEGA